MEVVKSPTGVLHIILNKEEQKMLCHAISGGSQAQIEFADDAINEDPLKHFNGKTKKAIVEIIKKFKTVAFSGYDIIEIKKKYYVPDIQDTFKRLEKRGFCTIENVSHNHKVYQFSEKLCRHYGN